MLLTAKNVETAIKIWEKTIQTNIFLTCCLKTLFIVLFTKTD